MSKDRDEKDGKSLLLELVEKAKCWVALEVLKRSTLVERREIVVRAFREACAYHDDENALLWFAWLLQAIQEDEDSRLELTEAMDFLAKETAKKSAEIQTILIKADIAKGLYLELPNFRLEPSRYADQPGTRLATLIKTKKAMLEAIAGGWRSAPTDDVADEFFMFIYKVDSGPSVASDDRELINEIIRKVTDVRFPLARLMYTLRNHPDLYADILAHAWVKNGYCYEYRSEGSHVGLILGAVGDFYKASPEATMLLGRVGAKILVADHQLRNLNKGRQGLIFGPPNLEFVRDKDNPKFDEVLACFKVVVFEEKEFHQQFEATRDRIIEAKKSWTVPVRIKLRGEFTFRYKHQITLPRTEDI